jgi:hypothetical protein
MDTVNAVLIDADLLVAHRFADTFDERSQAGSPQTSTYQPDFTALSGAVRAMTSVASGLFQITIIWLSVFTSAATERLAAHADSAARWC